MAFDEIAGRLARVAGAQPLRHAEPIRDRRDVLHHLHRDLEAAARR
jgi:hypothetical protein